MPHRVIRDIEDLKAMFRLLEGMKCPLTLQWSQGADRSLDQNALMWKWATEVSEQMGDRTAAEVQADWKLRHGVPILRSDNEDFRLFYDKALKGHPFEVKLKAMEYTPVTSIMNVRQMVKFMDTVQRETLQQGVRLTDPEADLDKYNNRYRSKAA